MADKGLGGDYTQPEGSVEEDKHPRVGGGFVQCLLPGRAHRRRRRVHRVSVCAEQPDAVLASRTQRRRDPTLPAAGMQAFVRGICDLHGVAPRPYLGQQFLVAYEVYLSIRAEVDKRVKVALGRDTSNWAPQNCLPRMHVQARGGGAAEAAFDRDPGRQQLDEEVLAPGARGGIPWCHPRLLARCERVGERGDGLLMRGFEEGAEQDEGTGCDERWENMKEDVTARAYGMAKYGLAVINHLIRVLGEVAVGVDIGCKMGKMVKAHPRLSQLAFDNQFRCLVGSFHGLGHGRLCQVSNLATYVEGMGLEDCEGCESWFSKSNALASTTRHQAIATYIQHADTCDAYQGLTVVIGNKYRRALKIKAGLPALQDAMRSLNVKSLDVFETWLAKEKQYLRSLSKEPVEETLEMEYYQKLVNWQDHERCVCEMRDLAAPFLPAPADASYAEAAKETRRVETKRRHAFKVAAKSLGAVQELELKLGITTCWEPGSEAWVKAAKMGLVVARMFELSKVNMSGTVCKGIKLRKHIAKALQARSKAVRTVLERYNAAASVMTPPKRLLAWDEVVGYAFLAEFDLLREGREDIRTEPWALPAGRAAMDQHFKILRADEEIARLNVEIPRLVTFMADEEDFLVHHEARLRQEGFGGLALQVARHRMERARFNSVHLDRLVKLSREDGFTASISRGTSVSQERRVPPCNVPDLADAADKRACRSAPSTGGDNDEDGEGDRDVEAITDAFENIVRIVHNVGATEEAG
ncbi:hypothetical protein B0H14DRAFT_2574435 [Mycena olivaceomarginata]|nr:hypothetical protein B0H14DRAFT_2574435 [Mycena olivaceomarginata]